MRGVYRRPLPHGDQAGRPLVRTEDDWQLPLLSIQWIMEHDVHLGGLSALGFHGLAHYLPLGGGEPIYLYREVPSSQGLHHLRLQRGRGHPALNRRFFHPTGTKALQRR